MWITHKAIKALKHLTKTAYTPDRLGLVQAGRAKGAKTGKNRQKIVVFKSRGKKCI
jgi:hypothetical protein